MFRNPGRTVFVVAALSLPVVISAQTDGARPSDGEIYETFNAEEQPEFPGGEKAMMTYLAKSLKYQENFHGQWRVLVGFIVEADGRLANVQVLRSAGTTLDNEAVRVVKAMPHWTPGRLFGKAVRVNYVLPVQFSISR